MVDTGATSSLITINTINKLNCRNQMYKQAGEIILGDAKTKLVQYEWIYLHLQINNFVCGVRTMVVDELTTELILGTNFLNKFKVEIKVGQQCLVMHHQQKQIHVEFEKPEYVKLAQQCTIWPRCKCVVAATTSKITNATKILLNVIDKKTQQYKRIRLCDDLDDVKDNSLHLTIYNPTKKLVTLPKSMCLGTIGQLGSDEYCSTLFSNATTEECEIKQAQGNSPISIKNIIDTLVKHLQTNEQCHRQIWNLLDQHQVSFDNSQSRTIKTTIHHVINTGNHPPINAKPYFKTIDQRKKIQGEVDKMLRAGIIIPSNSPWSSPVVLLTKLNGEFRFIIDYRRLNAITKKDYYPQSTVEGLLQRLGGHS